MKITALAGGVGGAKLAQGLAGVLQPDELCILVNTGDDFQYAGLHISPDLDTVCYTLAGIANAATGWGIEGDSFHTFKALQKMGGPDWFLVGDLDLATHLFRTQTLLKGESLTHITKMISSRLGVRHTILPMSDDVVSTWVETEEMGWLPFQEYFVKLRFVPKVVSFEFRGIEDARSTAEAIDWLEASDAIILCPSNPFVSIDPILSLGGLREIIEQKPVLCVSPIIKGQAVKGPLAKIFREMGAEPSPLVVAQHYDGLVDMLVMDRLDAPLDKSGLRSSIITHATDILIPDRQSRVRLAKEIIEIITRFINTH